MRQWRVGILTMGIAMIFVGVLLLSSAWQARKLSELLAIWWPIIFVLLGLEILIYFIMQRGQSQRVQYDVFSILFIGMLGTVCIGILFLSSTGLMDEIRYVVSAHERTVALPLQSEEMPEGITKIVIQAPMHGAHPIHLSTTTENKVHLLGDYRATYLNEDELYGFYKDEAVLIETMGDTMLIRLNPPPLKIGIGSNVSRTNWTMMLPKEAEVKVQAGASPVFMDGETPSSWDLNVNE